MTEMKLLCALVVFTMLFSLVGGGIASAVTTAPLIETAVSISESKHYSTATLDDNFDEDSVLVVMSNAASLENLEFKKEDFGEIDCKSIKNITQTTTDIVSAKRSGNKITEQRSISSEYATFSDFYDINTAEFHQILSIELEEPGKDNVLAAIKKLEQRSDVLYAGPNYIFSIKNQLAANEQAHRSEPWDPLYDEQWASDMINLPEAWNIAAGHMRKVVVGIVDGGIDAAHPDLEDLVDATKSVVIDTDGRRQAVSSVTDAYGHGTMIAGIIGAKAFNTLGIAGVNWNVGFVSIGVADHEGYTSILALAEALEVAQEQRIPILNISLGLEWDSDVTALTYAVQQYSGLIVCPAGNAGENFDNVDDNYPACIDSDNIIVVGASTSYDSPWYRSNYHPTKVHLFAPGAPVLGCFPTALCDAGCSMGYHHSDGYHQDAGTSYAAPYVAGVASLLLSMHGNQVMGTNALIYHLKQGVDVKSVYQGKCETNGRLNAYKTLSGHVFTATYNQYNSVYHKVYCMCTGYLFENHSWVDIGDMMICSVCGYMEYY